MYICDGLHNQIKLILEYKILLFILKLLKYLFKDDIYIEID